MPYGLTEEEIKGIVDILADDPKVEALILFGSRAKGNYSIGSDIDIAMIGKDLKLNDISKALVLLDELYLPYKLDLVIYHRIQEPALIEHICKVGIPLFKR
ncbi:MAG: nucleotidyltransferase domain-containing protein [Breznakibacter sp.]|nr:nucleotidyltransferase domain-containing protein [Breznakibacter sp.]